MKIKKISLLFFILLPLIFSVLAFSASAQGGGSTSGGGSTPRTGIFNFDNPLNATSFEDLVKSLASWLYKISIPLAVLMILYAAFLFMTSGGSDEKIKTAKKTLLWTLIGMAIILIGSGFITLIKDILQTK